MPRRNISRMTTLSWFGLTLLAFTTTPLAPDRSTPPTMSSRSPRRGTRCSRLPSSPTTPATRNPSCRVVADQLAEVERLFVGADHDDGAQEPSVPTSDRQPVAVHPACGDQQREGGEGAGERARIDTSISRTRGSTEGGAGGEPGGPPEPADLHGPDGATPG